MRYRILFFAIVLVIISNLPFVKILFIGGGVGTSYTFRAQNSRDFEFVCIPSKGRDLAMMEAVKRSYEQKTGHKITLCRTFRKSPFKFWNWYSYLISPYYKFDYCAPDRDD